MFLWALLCVTSFADGKTMEEGFSEYIQIWKKDYSESERTTRYQNFLDNVKEIESLNSRSGSSKIFGLTKFSDMSASEFKKIMKAREIPNKHRHYSAIPDIGSDLRTQVNQSIGLREE